MVEPISGLGVAKVLKDYLSAYNTYRKLVVDSRSLLQKLEYTFVKREFYDINEIFDEVEKGNINIGDTINVSGYLLKYGQCFKPYTHVNMLFEEAKSGQEGYTLKNGKLFKTGSVIASTRIFQPPIQSIPAFEGVGCAFLYDERFRTFEHQQNPLESERKEKPIIINQYSKPIIILYNKETQEKFINKKVDIKGKVISLDSEMIKSLNGIFDNTIREICSNFFRPYNENINFICISTIGNEVREVDNLTELEGLKAPLFVEAQLEDLNVENKDFFVRKLIPDLASKKINVPYDVFRVDGDFAIPYLTVGKVQVLFREPDIIGFYTLTELYNEKEFQERLANFENYINNFSLEYGNRSKKEIGEKKNMYLNFLFDYKKQYLFDKRGVLNSKTAKELYDLDENYRYIQDWLKNDTEKRII